jgi:hypothetical protein
MLKFTVYTYQLRRYEDDAVSSKYGRINGSTATSLILLISS